MATNYVQAGKVMDLLAPYDRTSGQGFQVGSLFAVALGTALSGAAIRGQVDGVWTLTKVGSQAWAVGDKIYWDNGNKRCTTDATAGMLIGVATVIAGAGAGVVTGVVRLNGSSPSTAEGPQGAIVALTDSSGYSGTHDDTIAATAAIVTLTDNTGGSGTHDDTIADGLTSVAPNAATAVDLDNEIVGNADAQGDIVAAAAGSCAGNAEPSAANVDSAIATAVAPLQANDATLAVAIDALIVDAANLRSVIGTLVTDVTVQNQNDSDTAQKIIELVTRDAVHAQNVSDVAQKILEIRTALIAAGILAAA